MATGSVISVTNEESRNGGTHAVTSGRQCIYSGDGIELGKEHVGTSSKGTTLLTTVVSQ